MTGRERIRAILNRQPRDRLAWTTLADDVTRSVMPRKFRDMPLLEFYREIGCDVMMFGNWGLPSGAEVVSPVRWVSPAKTTWTTSGPASEWVRESRWGSLTARFHRGHPTKYPVTTRDDLRVLFEICRDTCVEDLDSDEPEKSYDRAENAIGDAGLYFETTGPSPVQQLIEMDMGLETFYYFLADHAAEMANLLAAMHELRKREYDIIAAIKGRMRHPRREHELDAHEPGRLPRVEPAADIGLRAHLARRQEEGRASHVRQAEESAA